MPPQITTLPIIPYAPLSPMPSFIVRAGPPICNVPQVVPGYQHVVEEVDPIGATANSSGDLYLSDNPETINDSVWTVLNTNKGATLWQHTFGGAPGTSVTEKFRVFFWHENAVTDPSQLNLGLWINLRVGKITITSCAGILIKKLGDYGENILAAGLALADQLPPYTILDSSKLGVELSAPAQVRIFEETVVTNGFRGAILDFVVQVSDGYTFDLNSAIDDTSILSRTGTPVPSLGCTSPQDNVMVGHGRGTWDYSDITLPGSGVVVSDDPSEWVQFTLGQALFAPYSEDINLFMGDINTTPNSRPNKVLFGVNQHVRIPIINQGTSNAVVQGYLVCIGNQGKGTNFFAAVNTVPGGTDLNGVEMPYVLGNAVNVVNVTVPPGGTATAEFDMQTAGESNYPIGLLLQGVGTTTSTTSTSTTTTTTTSTSTSTSSTTQSSSTSTTSTTFTTSSSSTKTSTTLTTSTNTSTTATMCLEGSVAVDMWDGTSKMARDVRVGDELAGIDKEGNLARQVVSHAFSGSQTCLKVIHSNGEFVCSESHQIIEKSGAPIRVNQLSPCRHELVSRTGGVEIDAILPVGEKLVFGWECGPDHNFFAAGVLHHNKTITLSTTQPLTPPLAARRAG